MADAPLQNRGNLEGVAAKPLHCAAAMAILVSGADLRAKEGSFLGQVAFDANPLTEKQARWLAILIERYGAKGGVQ